MATWKERLVLETETHINALKKRYDQLFGELETVESELNEARGVLKGLKGGFDVPHPDAKLEVKQEQPQGVPVPIPVARQVEAEPKPEKRTALAGIPRAELQATVQKRWRDAVIELGKRPEGFTAQEIGEHLGMSKSAFGMALKSYSFLERMVTSTKESRMHAGRTTSFRIYRYKEPEAGPASNSPRPAPAQTRSAPVAGTGSGGAASKLTSDTELLKILKQAQSKGARCTRLGGGHIRVTNQVTGKFTTLSATSKNYVLAYARLKEIGYRF